LYRVHQFSKVELYGITGSAEESQKMMDQIVEHQIEFFSSLNLHFKTLLMPAEDLGAPASKKIDIEAWIPSKNDYGEVSIVLSPTNKPSPT